MTTAFAGRWPSGHRRTALFLAVVLLAVWGIPAAAAEGKKEQADSQGNLPIEITADRLLADSTGETVTFEGNVQAKQGEVTLLSDRLFAKYSGPAKTIDKIIAEGNVRVFHAGKEGHAERAVFYNQEQKIILSGGATLSQGGDSLAGDNVTIYLRENRSVVTGGDGGRVRAVIHPRGFPDGKDRNRDAR
jgi:lipopolysaccharide export system protein LptA